MLIGHKKQKEFLEKKAELDQLSHAYLFSGEDAIGKKLFAIEFAKLVNCREKNAPCQKCFNCQAIERGNFPDLMIISEANKKDLPAQAGEKFGDGGEIKIGQIREVQNFLSYKSYYGSFKIVVVDDAEKMNQEAQSCFLKTLEEPKGKTLLLLISSKPDMLLETIISRCQNIKFSKPKNLPVNSDRQEKEQKILDDLLSVISLSFSEKFKYVKAIDFEKQSASDILSVLQRYLRHLLMVKLGTEKGQGKDDNFKKYTIGELKKILNLAEDISKKLTFTNANPKLALEILLMEF
jgi:DNA polymerase III delta' subunit